MESVIVGQFVGGGGRLIISARPILGLVNVASPTRLLSSPVQASSFGFSCLLAGPHDALSRAGR